MSNDMLLERGETPGVYNLCPGEPVFLQQHLPFVAPRILPPAKLTYPPSAGQPELIKSINRYLETTYGNGTYKHIVICNGAKQAILASLYAFKKGWGMMSISHQAPYWLSYPTMAELSGMSFYTPNGFDRRCVDIVTSPNNPDGIQYNNNCDIWDAAYAHRVYGFHAGPFHKVAVYSASKLFGAAGLRIGWLATDIDDIAKFAAEYVEKSTSGVSNESQKRLLDILDYVHSCNDQIGKYYNNARDHLKMNGQAFLKYLEPHIETYMGVPAEGCNGMFAWFKPKDPVAFEKALKLAKVKVVPGETCGQPGFYRMSMGHEIGYTELALFNLKEQLENGK